MAEPILARQAHARVPGASDVQGPLTPVRSVVSQRALVLVLAMVLIDLVAVILAYYWAGEIRFGRLREPVTDRVIIVTVPVWLMVVFAAGMYSRKLVLEPALHIPRLVTAATVSTLLTIVIAFEASLSISRGWVGVLWVVGVVLLVGGRIALLKAVRMLNEANWLGLRTLVVGNNSEARTFARVLRKKRHLGYEVVGFVGDQEGPVDGLPVLASIQAMRNTVVNLDIAAVFVAGSDVGAEALTRVDRELEGLNVRIRTSLGLPHLAASRVVVQEIDGMAMLALERMRPTDSNLRLKRALDISLSAFGLVVALPLMLAIAIAIKVTDRGPIVFSQRRVGAGGAFFTMYKFRTMVNDAERMRQRLQEQNEADGVLFKLRRDPRVTPVGRHLRRLGLDELPQLFNVLLGEMSLVGPRPALPEEVEGWTPEVVMRLQAKPGVTGLWQVSGRHELAFEDYVRYDLFYVQNWSLALDLQIIARTLPALLSRAGAY